MIAPWIIEQIRRREEEARRQRHEQRLPLDEFEPEPMPEAPMTTPQEPQRGVVIIEMS